MDREIGTRGLATRKMHETNENHGGGLVPVPACGGTGGLVRMGENMVVSRAKIGAIGLASALAGVALTAALVDIPRSSGPESARALEPSFEGAPLHSDPADTQAESGAAYRAKDGAASQS